VKILVTFALETEFAPWRRLCGFERVPSKQGEMFASRIGDADVRVALTGAGHAAAKRASGRIFDDPPGVCVVSGLAGALSANYRPGDILVARKVSLATGYRAIESDDALLNAAADLGAEIAGRLVTSEQVVSTAGEKRRLASSGDAVDMESALIMETAARRGVRSVAIRAISDGADANLPFDFDKVFTEDGRVGKARLIAQLARRPRQLPALLRLARDSREAAESLAGFLHSYVRAVAHIPAESAKAGALVL